MRKTVITLCFALFSGAAVTDVVVWSDNLLVNPGAEAGSTAGWTNYHPDVISALREAGPLNPYGGTRLPVAGAWFFTMGDGPVNSTGEPATGLLRQVVDVEAHAALIDAGQLAARASVWVHSDDHPAVPEADYAGLHLEFIDERERVIDRWTSRLESGTNATLYPAIPNYGWMEVTLRGQVPPESRRIRFLLRGEKYESFWINVDFDDASLQVGRTSMVVGVDVKPNDPNNGVKVTSEGYVWAAMLGGPGITDVDIDPQSLRLGRGAAAPDRYRYVNVNGDEYGDVMGRFSISETGVSCADTELSLSGEALDGRLLRGTDSVLPLGC